MSKMSRIRIRQSQIFIVHQKKNLDPSRKIAYIKYMYTYYLHTFFTIRVFDTKQIALKD